MSADLIDSPRRHAERVDAVVRAFEAQYGQAPDGLTEAPGRVNLIGEHVDYNEGLVLPFAIDRSVLCAWRRREDGRSVPASFHSVDLAEAISFVSIDPNAHLAPWRYGVAAWVDYPGSIAWALTNGGFEVRGIDIAYAGDVPQGAGLSSSAAVEVAVAGAFRAAFGIALDDVALALLCQRAENEYVGVQCGIMDQFASALSRRDTALLLDCRTLAYRHVPLRLAEAGLAIVIANSAVKRELVTSAFNERRRECNEAVAILRHELARPALTSLRDVTSAQLAVVMDDGSTPLHRARHVVTEIERVAAAADALDRDDFARFGELMVESHLSLRNDYEVSSPQLDLLTGLATSQPYVLGARLTGAGFGGCTVNLVRADSIGAFARDVVAPYRERTGLSAVMYVTAPQEGLRIAPAQFGEPTAAE